MTYLYLLRKMDGYMGFGHCGLHSASVGLNNVLLPHAEEDGWLHGGRAGVPIHLCRVPGRERDVRGTTPLHDMTEEKS